MLDPGVPFLAHIFALFCTIVNMFCEQQRLRMEDKIPYGYFDHGIELQEMIPVYYCTFISPTPYRV